MGLRRFLDLDRLAGRFNRWFGPAAIATGVEEHGDPNRQTNPSAVVAVLGEVERQAEAPPSREKEEDLRPLAFDRASLDELRPRDETEKRQRHDTDAW